MAVLPRPKMLLAGVFGLFLLVGLAFHSAPKCGFVWDDDLLLTENQNLHTVAGLERCWTDPTVNLDYFPLTYTSWWLEGRLWGLDPVGYHIDNIVLHAINAVLLWLILCELDFPGAGEVSGAWIIAAVWAVHPVQVESVAWVAQRKNVLSGLFFFLSAWCFVRAWLWRASEDASTAEAPRRWWLYGLSLVLFVAAMFAKPVTMTLAGILPLLVWWKRGRIKWGDSALLAPYLLLALPMAVLTVWVQRHTVKATGWEFEQSFVERLCIAGRVVWFYAGKLAWPAKLCFAYLRWSIDVRSWAAYLPVLAAALVVAGLWLARRRLGRAPLTAVLIFIVALSPALGFFRIYWQRYYFVADHIQYLACAALIALVVGTAAHYLQRQSAAVRRAAAGAAGAGLVGLVFLSSRLVPAYHDVDTLWQETLTVNPQCWMAYTNLASHLLDRSKQGAAIPLYRKALEYNPRLPEAHDGLGLALSHYGQTAGGLPEAIDQFRLAIAENPQDGQYHCDLGNALAQSGQPREALAEFDRSLELAPNDSTVAASAHYQRGKALVALGQPEQAIAEVRRAIQIKPDDWMPHNDLGVMLGHAGQLDDAVSEFAQAARLAPGNAKVRKNLAQALRMQQARTNTTAVPGIVGP